ncbi:hypothetical protein SLEP1_g39918 [Rubroshorea leprosula]|uniref:Uncharacterized protein n=1 Tax=Rubroshorea leprosula TaxID=152421 RepID=A0AAV5L282_9ROSI|nr:hypothetical protein SLEP1_g39918 [Rubroshorea leprosula]
MDFFFALMPNSLYMLFPTLTRSVIGIPTPLPLVTAVLGCQSYFLKGSKTKSSGLKLYQGSVPCASCSSLRTGVGLTSFGAKLGISVADSPTLFCGQIKATYLSSNLVLHSCMKHI